MGRLCHKSITATALLLIFVAVFPKTVESNGSVFELDLESLENYDGRAISGGCCSGQPRVNGSCSGDCAVYLHFCFRHFEANPSPSSDCTYFQLQTSLLGKNGSSRGSYDVAGQGKMYFDLPFTWPGQFNLIVEAWHPPEQRRCRYVPVVYTEAATF
ncbi:delta-like protein [Caerostris extrusa]|uniref:Delta-like protein n=1 Tax=Caerostris extrusa TaxID=172846 RepID=A0AAV4R2M6_CAEEX|nr:delta-like protein [Caerostris extrusa]